jgi:hypothetical protein
LHSRICATLCLLSAVFAAPAAARTPAQLHTDVADAVHAFVQADSFPSGSRSGARKRDAALQPLRSAAPAEVAAIAGADVFRWLTVGHQRCYAIGVRGHGYSSPFGPCLSATAPCASVCIASLGFLSPTTGAYVFYAGGTVPAAATSVAITLLGGQHVTVKPGTRLVDGRRGVMAFLRRGDIRSAVARAGSRVVGRMARSAASVHHECMLLRLRCASKLR